MNIQTLAIALLMALMLGGCASQGSSSRCPELLTGKNSVSPCKTPSTSA